MENKDKNGKKMDQGPQRSIFATMLWVILSALMVVALVYSLKMDTKVTNDSYYQIVDYFDKGQITEYSLNMSSRKLTYTLKGEKTKRTYTVPNVSLFVEDVHKDIREYNKAHPDAQIKMNYVAGTSGSWVAQLLPMVGMLIICAILLWWLFKKMNNSVMNENNRTMAFGKARLKSNDDEERKTTFDDVAGVDEEKEDLQEIVEFLRAPEKFNDLGARIPKGVLLVGPPGTGKTLLARAVAGEADATFLSISGSDFVEMYVGVGASRVRDLFETAKKNVPAIVFIDEIDAVGRHRGAGMGGGHDEREQTLNQLLVEMDGFGANVGVIIIAATNRPDILDPALLRPGRFDRQVTVNHPDVLGREAILKVHARNKPIGPDVSLSEIARATSGFTGADLENLLNEAALLAARRNKKAITKVDIEEATIKVVVGTEKKSKKITDKEKRLTAYHESGHAITNFYLEDLDPVHQISIIPRGRAGGYTMSLPKEDKSYASKNHMLNELVTLLGGRVAEAIVLGDVSTGASNDIERATNIARSMITKYGMSEKLGPICYGDDNEEVFLGKNYNHMRNYSEDTASEIDKEINRLVTTAYDRAEEILREHIDQLYKLAGFLISYEKIDGEVFKMVMTDDNFDVDAYMKDKEDTMLKLLDSKEDSAKDSTEEDEDVILIHAPDPFKNKFNKEPEEKVEEIVEAEEVEEVTPVVSEPEEVEIKPLDTSSDITNVTLSEAEIAFMKELENENKAPVVEEKKPEKKSKTKKQPKAEKQTKTERKVDAPAKESKGKKSKKTKKSKNDDSDSSDRSKVFDGSEFQVEDIPEKALSLTSSIPEVELTTSTLVEPETVEMPAEPFVTDEDSSVDVLPTLEMEPLNIGGFINNMSSFNNDILPVSDTEFSLEPEVTLSEEPTVDEEAEYDSNFNYEEEKNAGHFTENDEIFALYELLKQTRDITEKAEEDVVDWKETLTDDGE